MRKRFEREKQMDSYSVAERRVKRIKGFYSHAAVYVIVNVFILVQIFINKSATENMFNFGNFSTALLWGLGLLAHGMSVFGQDWLFGSNWEQRKIREIMEREKKEKWE